MAFCRIPEHKPYYANFNPKFPWQIRKRLHPMERKPYWQLWWWLGSRWRFNKSLWTRIYWFIHSTIYQVRSQFSALSSRDRRHSFRCDPQATNHYCNGDSYGDLRYIGSPTFTDLFGDNQWHQLQWHIKINSNPGENDGIIEFWFDGELQYSKTNHQWLGVDNPGNIGWNTFGIGGNAFNSYAQESAQAEQWYAIDDIIISTTPFATTAYPIIQAIDIVD